MIIVLSSVTLLAKNSTEASKDNISKTNSIFFNDIVTQDTFYIQTSDCAGTGAVCIDIPMSDVANYTFTDSGMMYSAGFQECLETTIYVYDYAQLFGQGNLGPYTLNNWMVNGVMNSGVFATIPDLLDSMNLWNPNGNWILDNVGQTISGGEAGLTYTTMDVTVNSIPTSSTIPVSTASTFGGVELNLTVGTHLVQVLENGGGMCLDSFFVNVVCVQPNIENFILEEDSVHLYCFDSSDFLGLPTTTEILCSNNAGTPANFNLTTGNSCVEITAMSVGQDTACYVICDNFGICDTTTIYIDVIPPVFNGTVSWIFDTIYVNSPQHTTCIDTSEMAGQVIGISNGCPGQSGEYALFSVNGSNYCVNYSAIEIGKDTACIEVIDNYGNVDTTYIVACVSNPTTDTMYQSVSLGNLGNFCIDTTQLGGVVSIVENLCTSGASGVAAFTIDSETLCFEALTSNIGQDTACVVVCDNFGTCDTTILIVEVTEATATNLVAMDDMTSIMLGEQLDFNICDNDSIPNGFLTNYYILPISFGGVGPNEGLVTFDSECNISYLPTASECGVLDSFNYVICNAQGCDTALVIVDIACENAIGEDLEFANGFSPNGDEVNQFFTVKGAETLQSSTLTIFNRWGNQVYKSVNYQNDWDGTFNGTTLQNGTYFYLFEDDAGNTYTGYVYLQR